MLPRLNRVQKFAVLIGGFIATGVGVYLGVITPAIWTLRLESRSLTEELQSDRVRIAEQDAKLAALGAKLAKSEGALRNSVPAATYEKLRKERDKLHARVAELEQKLASASAILDTPKFGFIATGERWLPWGEGMPYFDVVRIERRRRALKAVMASDLFPETVEVDNPSDTVAFTWQGNKYYLHIDEILPHGVRVTVTAF